jgi:hydrogenase/urease accessory protein HupE
MGIVLSLISVVAGFSMNYQTSRFVGAILKGAQMGAKYLSYIPYKSYAPFIFLLGSGILLALAHRLNLNQQSFFLLWLQLESRSFTGSGSYFL